MTKRDLSVYIQDIIDSIEKIEEYTTGITEDEFMKNSQVHDAVLRRLEIVGEAVKKVPPSVRGKHPQVPWKKIAGLRDVLIHEYFGVSGKRIWKVVKDDLLVLKSDMAHIKKGLES